MLSLILGTILTFLLIGLLLKLLFVAGSWIVIGAIVILIVKWCVEVLDHFLDPND